MTGSSTSGEWGASEAASLVFRIATVGLSLVSAIMTTTGTQCQYDAAGRPEATVSYNDYPSFRYAAAADVVSAVLQGVAICLEATGRKKAAKVVELIDKLVLALTSTSAALLLAADEITSCGPRQRGGERRRPQGSSRIRVASALSLAGAFSASGSVYTTRAPEAVTAVVSALTAAPARRRSPAVVVMRAHTDDPPPPSPPPPPTKSPGPGHDSPKKTPLNPPSGPSNPPPPPSGGCGCDGKSPEQGPLPCTRSCPDLPMVPTVVPPWCRCPRLTIPCHCQNPELCSTFF